MCDTTEGQDDGVEPEVASGSRRKTICVACASALCVFILAEVAARVFYHPLVPIDDH